MADFNVVFDPMLDKERAEFITGGTGGGGGVTPVGGYRISIAGGTYSFTPVATIQTVTGSSVTIQPDTAYKIYAISSAVTLNANVPASNQWAYDGHLEIFVANTGYVVMGSNVVLANALEPDAVNNCTVRFHDGYAIISVEDHVAGYIVTVDASSGAGSLAYGLATATNEYISVDASLNGQTLDLGGAVTNGEKHVVGNGYSQTIVSGGINCTSKTTLSNLAANGVVVSSGTLTLGDVYIPNGATVAVSGGGLAVEKVSGNGGTVNLGNTRVQVTTGNLFVSGCIISGGSTNTNGGAFFLNGTPTLELHSATVTKNYTPGRGGGIALNISAKVDAYESIVSGNSAPNQGTTADALINSGCVFTAHGGCTLGIIGNGGSLVLEGSNTVNQVYSGYTAGVVIVSSGAILDLTGNTNATPIAPGGGIVVDGGCTVITSAGASVSIAGGTYTKINNDGTTE